MYCHYFSTDLLLLKMIIQRHEHVTLKGVYLHAQFQRFHLKSVHKNNIGVVAKSTSSLNTKNTSQTHEKHFVCDLVHESKNYTC